MYRCNCPDNDGICKHIHKVQAVDLRDRINEVFDNEFLYPMLSVLKTPVYFQAAISFEYPTQTQSCPYAELLNSDDDEDHISTSVPTAERIEDDKEDFLNCKRDDLDEVKNIFLQIQKTLQAQEEANTPFTHTRNFLNAIKHWQSIISTDVNFTANPSLTPLRNNPPVQPNSNFAKQPTYKSIKKVKKKKFAKNQKPRMINSTQTQVL